MAFEPELAHNGPAPLAIIEAFYPGLRGGEALAQGIYGKHNKFGRLPCVSPRVVFTSLATFICSAISLSRSNA